MNATRILVVCIPICVAGLCVEVLQHRWGWACAFAVEGAFNYWVLLRIARDGRRS